MQRTRSAKTELHCVRDYHRRSALELLLWPQQLLCREGYIKDERQQQAEASVQTSSSVSSALSGSSLMTVDSLAVLDSAELERSWALNASNRKEFGVELPHVTNGLCKTTTTISDTYGCNQPNE
jgi:hypothetical protein